VLFKTDREKQIQIGREYDFPPMGLGECRIVHDDDGAGGGAKEGQVIFMKVGPVNLMPFVDNYEQENAEKYDNRLKPVIKDKKEKDMKKLIKKEQRIIHSTIQLPCRVTYIDSRLGKIPSTHKNTIFMEYDRFLELLSYYLPDTLNDNSDFKAFLNRDFLLDGFADQFILQLPKPRSSFYLQKFEQVM
jgi:hypothetical protein